MTPGLVIKEGPTIRIRQLREDDVPRMAAGSFGGEDGARNWYAQEMAKPDGPSGGFRQFAVEKVSGEWIGWTGFGAKRDGDAGGYFTIAEPFRRQGYGTELVGCVLKVMFEDCGAARCEIDYHDWNTVAEHIYLKLGFQEKMRVRIPEDKLTEEDKGAAPGRPVYAVVVELTKERWQALGSRAVQ